MDVEAAVAAVRRSLPFDADSHMHPANDSHAAVARAVRRHLRPGGRILDFGAGPCDKTAVLAQLGYRCTAYDDLQDPWVLEADNVLKILDFAASAGIEYVVADGSPLPFMAGTFDMVVLCDVLEHLHESPRELLNDLLELVGPEGLLLVTVPNAGNIRKRLMLAIGRTNLPDYREFYLSPSPWRGHVREHVRGDLTTLAELLGVHVLELGSIDQMTEKVPPRLLPAYRLVTRVIPGWRDTWLMVARKPAGWRPRREAVPPSRKGRIH